jgi:2',3'-cyclic-nucleotide 2'-phosphodiesterase (5'-nucleotidase family)
MRRMMGVTRFQSITGMLCLLVFLLLGPLSCARSQSEPETLLIIHSNDTHGTFLPYSLKIDESKRLVGGMEAASHYINELRKTEPNSLLIDTGDVMTGTLATKLEYNGVKGGVMIEFLNRLGYDIWCLGNHAFDQGQENARALLSLASFPTVLCNLVYKDTEELFAPKPYAVLTVGGLKVGIIGVMEERFMIEVDKKYIEGLTVLPVVPTLNSYLNDLDKQTDLIIVLVHGKFPTGELIAEKTTGIDLILLAHENGEFKDVNGILLKSTLGHQRTLGTLTLRVMNDEILSYEQDLEWLWADVDLSPEPGISALVQEMDALVKAEYDRVIGRCEFDWTREACPVENVLGNWITDAMRWKTGADIAFQNSGGIRSDIEAGPITIADIHSISPFNNTLVVFEMTGEELKAALEEDVERDWDRLQVSGIKYKHFLKESKPQGQRVEYVDVGGEVLVRKGEVLLPDRIYTVTTNDYVFNMAKEKYFGFSPNLVQEKGLLLTQVLTEWIEKHEVLICEAEDRITLIK